MKILHTADLHLIGVHDNRWRTLTELLRIGKAQSVDLCIICGDLFDRSIDSERLRPQIRELFSGNGFRILILPGNHDQNAYREGLFFGDDAYIVDDWKTPFEIGDVSVWGVPFEKLSGTETIERIRGISSSLTSTRTNILLLHGELLDSFFQRTDFGDEGQERYMPVRLSYFENTGFDYVLAGHFHRSFDIRSLHDGGSFVYPGSPVSITKRETGRRRINLFSTGGEPCEFLLDTPHYESVRFDFDPFGSSDPFEALKQKLDAVHPSAKILLEVGGYIDSSRLSMSEKEVIDRIADIVGARADKSTYVLRDTWTTIEDELFKKVREKIDHKSFGEDQKERMLKFALRAMMEAEL
jgi:exonuclease SbcD